LASGTELADQREQEFPFPDPALSADGQRCLRHEAWERLRLRDVASGATITTFSADPDVDENVACAAFSPDGRRIVSGTYDTDGCGALHIWDATTGTRLATMSMLVDFFRLSTAFDRDDKRQQFLLLFLVAALQSTSSDGIWWCLKESPPVGKELPERSR
jgi:WD40 repeat protein